MTPVDFPEANVTFGPPPDMNETQVRSIRAFVGGAFGGSVDGTQFIVLAWKPSFEELQSLISGEPVFLTIMGRGLPPHFLSTSFEQAINPA